MDYQRIMDAIADAEFVIVGIGQELALKEGEDVSKAYCGLKKLLAHKTYFILTENEDTAVFESGLLDFFICAPYAPEPYNKEEQWKSYLTFLSGTLGHKTCMLELGVGLNNPQLIRWPFEKTVQFNQKGSLVRVHSSLAMLPEGLDSRGIMAAENAKDFLERFAD